VFSRHAGARAPPRMTLAPILQATAAHVSTAPYQSNKPRERNLNYAIVCTQEQGHVQHAQALLLLCLT
jgi:hypothetical protein